jgi:hypothetical protein
MFGTPLYRKKSVPSNASADKSREALGSEKQKYNPARFLRYQMCNIALRPLVLECLPFDLQSVKNGYMVCVAIVGGARKSNTSAEPVVGVTKHAVLSDAPGITRTSHMYNTSEDEIGDRGVQCMIADVEIPSGRRQRGRCLAWVIAFMGEGF